ncbi:MAG: hypothetical protein JWN99_2920 [Ilumatobacteraceae bacterium]|nr:hypothetical protein [Ilumatobacteraceae bacterium]
MTEQTPLDATLVARILRRAGDLEAVGEWHDDAGMITEASLIAAAEEVGLSVDAVRRSIAFERLGPLPSARRGDRMLGPSRVSVDGEVDVLADDALARIDSWMVDGHHLRRDALRGGKAEWSKRSGLVGATVRTIRNVTGEGKLGVFEHVDAAARDTGTGSSAVRITIDRTKNRRVVGGSGAGIAGAGATATVVAAAVATPILLFAMPVALAAGAGVAFTGRKRARDAESEIRRVLDAVREGVDPTRLSVDVVRRATGKATAAGSSARRAVGRLAPKPLPPPPNPRSIPDK